MTDKFEDVVTALDSPADSAFSITPNDGSDLPTITRALYIGVSGDVAVLMRDGSEALFTNAQAGSVLALRVARVKATGTSAQNILGLV